MDIYLVFLEEDSQYHEEAGMEAGHGRRLTSDGRNAHSILALQDSFPNPRKAIVRSRVGLAMVAEQVGCRRTDPEQRTFYRTETAGTG